MVAHIGVEALKALDYAHSKRDHDGLPLKLVHRDVSPENIMVTLRGEVQLLDFGVLKIDDDRRRGTDLGELQGNLAFMAPEQARGQEVDARADLFALGLVLYFALTGEPLYGSDTGYDLLLKAASGPGRRSWPSCRRCRRRSPRCCTGRCPPGPRRASPTPSASPRRCRPPAADAAASLAALVNELFGEELAEEQQQLGASSAGRLTSTASSGTGAPVQVRLRPLRRDRDGPRGGGVGAERTLGLGARSARRRRAPDLRSLPAAREDRLRRAWPRCSGPSARGPRASSACSP